MFHYVHSTGWHFSKADNQLKEPYFFSEEKIKLYKLYNVQRKIVVWKWREQSKQ